MILRVTENRNIMRVTQRNVTNAIKVSFRQNNIIFNTTQRGSAGVGVPINGLTNQVLSKASNTNYDTEWVDIPIGYVKHDNNSSTARPSGYTSVMWVGSVEPNNAIDGDIWNQLN
jgi:hypothetical protein